MPKIETHAISYVPHHNTLTAGGKSHFSRIADGIAEFVDNSIQATESQPLLREIHVSFFLNREVNNESGYVAISDNGVGMTKATIEQFATYALDRETRNLSSEDGGRSSIGKFGVGAKQAGFYIGNRLRVITKRADNPKVLEFVLDREVLDERYKNHEDVYTGVISTREVGDNSLFAPDEIAVSPMQVALREHEENNKNFTIIVIRMHRDIVTQMLNNDRYNVLPNELAEIYHFHLHPEHSPKEIVALFPKSERSTKISSTSNLHITCNIWLDHATGKWHNKEADIASVLGQRDTVRDPVQKCIEKAESAFKFVIDIPDPSQTKTDANSRTSSKHKVEGIIFYYPFKRGKETRPTPSSHYETAAMYSRRSQKKGLHTKSTGGKAFSQKHSTQSTQSNSHSSSSSATSSANSNGSGNDDSDVSSDEMDENSASDEEQDAEEKWAKKKRDAQSKGINIYWQNRFVPESSLERLPFFPAARTRLQCSTEKIPENWMGRIKGFLFFDNKFTHISNNKLRLQADPNLETWLITKAKAKSVTYDIPKMEETFLKWLRDCHLHYDRDFKFDMRDVKREKATGGTSAFFKRLTVGNNRAEYVPGDIVKLHLTQSGKGGGKNVPVIYGRITGFEIPEGLEAGEDRYFGHGRIRYIREPESIFKLKDTSVSLAAIDFTSTDSVKATTAEVNKIRTEAPQRVVLRLYSKIDSKPVTLKDTFKEAVGSTYYKITVEIFDQNNNKVVYRPQSKDLYQVKLAVGTTDFGLAKELYFYDTTDKTDKKVTQVKERGGIDSTFYGFYGNHNGKSMMSFGSAGTCELICDVLDPVTKESVLPKPILVVIITEPAPVSYFDLQCCTLGIWPLGEDKTVPEVKFIFRDADGAVCLLEENVKVKATAEDMILLCEQHESPELPMCLEDEGQLHFYSDQWQATPKTTDGSFLSADEVLDKEVEITFQIFLKRVVRGVDIWDIEIGTGKSIKIIYCPGRPMNIVQISPKPGDPIELTNNDVAPSILIACVDSWGNRTAPHQGENWRLVLDEAGPLQPPASRPGYSIPVFTTGEAAISDFTANSLEGFTSALGSNLTHLVELHTHGLTETPRLDCPSLLLNLLIKPAHFPSTIEVLYQDRSIPNPWKVPLGALLSDLTFRVLDEAGEEIDMEDCWFKKKSSGLEVSWKQAARRAVKTLPTTTLPNIQMPSAPSKTPVEFNVELKTDIDSTPLLFQFEISMAASEPVAWKILTTENLAEGVMSGLDRELLTKIRCVCLVDAFGNVVGIDKQNPSFREPVLTAYYAAPGEVEGGVADAAAGDGDGGGQPSSSSKKSSKRKRGQIASPQKGPEAVGQNPDSDGAVSTQDNVAVRAPQVLTMDLGTINFETNRRTAEIDLANIDGVLCYLVKKDNFLTASPAPCDVWLRVQSSTVALAATQSSESVVLKPCTIQFVVTAGLPFRFEMTCPSLQITEPTRDITATVARFTEVSDLTIKFYDHTGNAAKTNKCKGWDLKIALIGANTTTIFKKKDMTTNTIIVPLNFARVFSLDNAPTGNFDLEVSSSFKLGNKATVHLEVGSIRCLQVRLNTVSAIAISIIRDSSHSSSSSSKKSRRSSDALTRSSAGAGVGADDADRSEEEDMVVTVDEKLFSFKIELTTDDGVTYVPPIDSVTITAERSVLKLGERREKNGINNRDLYTHESFDLKNLFGSLFKREGGGFLEMVSKDVEEEGEGGSAQASFLPLGKYTFSATYTEGRDSLASIPDSMRVRSSTFSLEVDAGAAASITADEKSVAELDNAAATNIVGASEDNRTIGRNIIFLAEDQYQNSCVFPKNSFITCFFRYPDEQDSLEVVGEDYELPVLKDSKNGYLVGRISLDRRSCKFATLELVAGKGKGDRLIEISFNMYIGPSAEEGATSSSLNYSNMTPALEAQRFTFRFSTDQGQLARIAMIKADLAPLLEASRVYEAERDGLDNKLGRCTNDISRVLDDAVGDELRNFRNMPESLTQSSAAHLAARLSEQKNDMESSSDFRPAKREKESANKITAIAGLDVIGLPIDLAYVEDANLAFMLSWAADYFMDVMVVHDTNTAKTLLSRKLKALALDQVRTFRVDRMPRNATQIASCQLPLPAIGTTRGNPRYMVNMLQLDAKNEGLRDSLFFQIFKNAILFDDLDSAMEYRRAVIHRDSQPPNLYTVCGQKVGTDGVLDPNKGRRPANLKNVFGMQPPSKSSVYVNLVADLRVVESLSDLLKLKKDLQDELENLDQPPESSKAKIRQLQQGLEEYGMPATQQANAKERTAGRYSRKITRPQR